MTPAFAALLAFLHVTVVDGSGVRPDQTVVVDGGRITAVGRRARVPAGTITVDGRGRWMIPGLVDAHVHLSSAGERALLQAVRWGVTTVRDLGSNLDELDRWRSEIAAGTLVGPRIVRCGPFVDGPKEMDPERARMTIVVRDAGEGRAAVRALKGRGVDCIKANNGLSRDAFLAVAAEAKLQRLPLVVHLPHAVRIDEAADAGARSVEHIESLVESEYYGAGDSGDDTPALARVTDDKARALFARFARAHVFLDPTLVASRAFARQARSAAELKGRAAFLERFEALVKLAHEAGVRLVAGSDLAEATPAPGEELHDELMLLVEAGLSPAEALRAATVDAAALLGDADGGAIAAGKRADLVLLDGDPLADIANTRKIRAVVYGGRLLQPNP